MLARDDLRAIAALAAWFGVEAYLVGGAPRDLLLGEEANDLDFALSGAWEELPAAFALHIGGSFFWLDAERRQARVVNKEEKGVTVYDYAPINGADIREDLARRDFTINALAIPLFCDQQEIFDPLHGRADLHAGIVRMCSTASFRDDPLRLLRAVRFSAELGFAIEDNTREEMQRQAGLLKEAAAERIRDELFKTVTAPGCGVSLRKLAASGLWREIIAPLAISMEEKDIARSEAVERLCAQISQGLAGRGKPLADYLGHEVESGISVLSLIKLVACLGGETETAGLLAERLRFGKEAGKMLRLLCRAERGNLADMERTGSERGMFRYFRDREPAGPGMLLIARTEGAVSEDVFYRLMEYWLQDYDSNAPDLLLSGGEIMNILAISPGKAVGEAMARLREAECAGEVKSREEAREFIKNLLTKEEPMG